MGPSAPLRRSDAPSSRAPPARKRARTAQHRERSPSGRGGRGHRLIDDLRRAETSGRCCPPVSITRSCASRHGGPDACNHKKVLTPLPYSRTVKSSFWSRPASDPPPVSRQHGFPVEVHSGFANPRYLDRRALPRSRSSPSVVASRSAVLPLLPESRPRRFVATREVALSLYPRRAPAGLVEVLPSAGAAVRAQMEAALVTIRRMKPRISLAIAENRPGCGRTTASATAACPDSVTT